MSNWNPIEDTIFGQLMNRKRYFEFEICIFTDRD